ncbi:uncharacterized protein Dana_GF28102 [Drosophila ananassae]|uniref:Uncharacterized protein n=1 Tax=Drosophila ananassae TaxID=7217 RepID=A0A0P8XDU1_DROAN|nr:uncharacterized protein Dana_GF28102 [Drosophila ananassae]
MCLVEFTNIKCTSPDLEHVSFDYCYLKSVNRTYKYLSLKGIMYKKPVSNVKVTFALLKKFSGYKPFLYNITVDACKSLRNPNANPVFAFFYGFYHDFSNLNHTCPYNHDVIVEKLPISHVDHQFSKLLAFPTGEYQFFTDWFIKGINRATVRIYFRLY